jgi:hypothetical protein
VRWLRRFCRYQEACFLTTYEDLAADPAGETERICDFVGIEFTPAMLDLPWRRNTSFRSVPRRSLNMFDRLFVAAAMAALRLVPLRALLASPRCPDRRQPLTICHRRRSPLVVNEPFRPDLRGPTRALRWVGMPDGGF